MSKGLVTIIDGETGERHQVAPEPGDCVEDLVDRTLRTDGKRDLYQVEDKWNDDELHLLDKVLNHTVDEHNGQLFLILRGEDEKLKRIKYTISREEID